jgi:DNA-binding MarR family transcriptional regulator
VKAAYLEAIRLTERLHRQFLELVKSELDRLGIEDINNVQAFILFNIGSDDYLGSNVSYNVRKMVENGYLMQERSTHDRRSIRVKLSAKGLELCQMMDRMFDRQISALGEVATDAELTSAANTFRRLERFWIGMLDYGLRT